MAAGTAISGADLQARGGPDGVCGAPAWRRADALTVVVIAAAVRLIYAVETAEVPFLQHLVGDARGYYEWAQRIAAGEWLGRETFYQAPLYPYVLACVRVALGEGIWAIRLVQSLWGAGAAGFLYVAAGQLFGRRAGVIAGLMWAMFPPAIFFDGIVQKASLAGVLACLLVMLTATVGRPGNARRVGWLGVIAGLLVLVRENAAIWVMLLGGWVGWLVRATRWSKGCVIVGVFALGVAVVLVPCGIRNRVVGGEWSLSTFQMGPNFYIGNRREADGRYESLVRGRETPMFERVDATRLAEEAVGRTLTAQEVSRYWRDAAIREIRAEPWRWLGLMGKKLLMVFNRYEVADAESLRVYEDHAAWLGAIGCVWHFGALCPLAGMGVLGTWHLRRGLWLYYAMIIFMAGAIAAFFVLARYRFVLVPLLVPFAAAGCDDLLKLLKGRRYRPLLGRLAVGLVVAVVVNMRIQDENRLDALAYMNAGVALAEGNEIGEAMTYFLRAVDGCPDSAEARNNLAQALSIQARFEEAIPQYRAALALAPTLAGVEYNLAVALERVGAMEDALAHYERALELNPGDKDAEAAVARLTNDRE